MSTSFQISESEDRLKVIIPTKVSKLLLATYSIALLIWIAMLIVVTFYLIRGRTLGIVHAIILLVWGSMWLYFGRFLWQRWQYSASNREILFFERDQLILRRPVSILGITTVYDIDHVGPFYMSDRHNCPTFDYAFLHVYFAQDLEAQAAKDLIIELNKRFFPDSVDKPD